MGTLSAVELHRRWVGLGLRSVSIGWIGIHITSASGTNGDGGPERKEKSVENGVSCISAPRHRRGQKDIKGRPWTYLEDN